MAASNDREQAMEKVRSSLEAFVQRYKTREGGKVWGLSPHVSVISFWTV